MTYLWVYTWLHRSHVWRMMSEPHFSSSQSPMLATTHEDISGIPDMVEEPCVGIVHKGHMDLQTQEERYGLEIVDLTHTY